MANLSDEILDRLLRNTINVVRVAEGLSPTILAMLGRLERELLSDLEDVIGKTEFTLTRMRELLKQTQAHIAAAYGNIAVLHERKLIDIAEISARQTVGQINAAVGAAAASVQRAPEQIKAISANTIIAGSPAGDWWKQQDISTRLRLKREMQTGQLRGETIDQLARRVRGTKAMGFKDGVMEASRNQAQTLVRTSALGVSNAARMETYAKNDTVIKGVQWHATLDPRTCPICIPLDGNQWNYPDGDGAAAYADYKPVGHKKQFEPAPIHFNCRCVVIPVTKSWAELAGEHGNSAAAKLADDIPEDTRASMDGQVAAKMTFEEWLKTKDAAFQNEVLGVRRAESWRSGKLQLSGLTDQSNKPLTLAQLGVAPAPTRPFVRPPELARPLPEPPKPPALTPETSAAFKAQLSTEPISGMKKNRGAGIGGGIEESHVVNFTNGTKGIFKPGGAWKNEVAASDIADALGGLSDMVQPTIRRVLDGREGSLQAFVPSPTLPALTKPPLSAFGASEADVARAAAWDYLIANGDRHYENWLIDAGNKIRLIDHGRAIDYSLAGGRSWLVRRAQGKNNTFERMMSNPPTKSVPPMEIPAMVVDWVAKWPAVEAYMKEHGYRDTIISNMKSHLDEMVTARNRKLTFADLLHHFSE